MLIKNFDQLGTTEERKSVLQIAEAGLESIQPENVINTNFPDLDLKSHSRVFLVGFGKGSAELSKLIEEKLDDKLTKGWVIDLKPERSAKISFTVGTHPLPSQTNINFTNEVLNQLQGLTVKDLVLVVVCGGGSALFTSPHNSLDQILEINKTLLKSGVSISDMNIIRKKLDKIKGGGFAKLLYPASVVSLVFSDVPGNDLATIASGPLVKDPATTLDAWELVEKYQLPLAKETLLETPKEDKYFQNVHNFLMLSNLTALTAMKTRAEKLFYPTRIVTDKIQGESREIGKQLLSQSTTRGLLLAGGETTVTAHGTGKGGRNQEVVLGASEKLTNGSVICSLASDGWDNTEFAGAISDAPSVEAKRYLDSNDSFHFFEKFGGGIITGRLPSNVADLIMILKS